MNENIRIELDDSPRDMIMKMSDGNPGALSVMMMLLRNEKVIDPMDWAGPIGPLINMDSHGIYGSRIWMLYKDVCEEDLVNIHACLRGVQLGIISEDVLNYAIDNRGIGIDVPDILTKVMERLPKFNR